MTKVKYSVLFRLVVATVVIAFVVLVGLDFVTAILRESINQLYVYSDNNFWKSLFFFLSFNQEYIGVILVLISLFFMYGWAINPMLKYFGILKSSLDKLIENDVVDLPKPLSDFEISLNNIKNKMSLQAFELKETEQQKNTMITYLAHDIRTPLTTIIGYQELINESDEITLNQVKDFNSITLRKSYYLKKLVDELFELTQFNISHMEIVKDKTNINILLTQIKEEFKPAMDVKDINCVIDTIDDAYVYVDGLQIGRVFENVINNAINYSEVGSELGIKVMQENDCLKVVVSNTGSYIPQDKLDRIFEIFYRGDQARNTDGGRSGIGLSVAKRIVEAHEGKIYARSDENITSFYIELPL